GYLTDGQRFQNLLRNRPEAQPELRILEAYSAFASGKRPADLDADAFLPPENMPENSPILPELHALRAEILLDQGQVEAAAPHMQARHDLLKQVAVAFRGSVLTDLAWYAAFHRGDPASADAYLELYRHNPMMPRFGHALAQAASAFAKGDLSNAESLLSTAQSALEDIPESGLRALATDRVAALQSQIAPPHAPSL
ncbi:MAG: hypothetical protein AAF570_26525, partial [Bacteroidota bacterium]